MITPNGKRCFFLIGKDTCPAFFQLTVFSVLFIAGKKYGFYNLLSPFKVNLKCFISGNSTTRKNFFDENQFFYL